MSEKEQVLDLRREPRLKIALLSDTHGFLDPRVARAAARHDCAVHAGDVGSAGVLETLQAGCPRVWAVRGNNDVAEKWPAADGRTLESLSDVLRLKLPGGVLAVVHGHRAGRPSVRHLRLRERFADARAVVFGHSHHRCVDKSARPWILNPGAAGKARAYGGPGLLSLTVAPDRWRIREVVFPPN